MSEIFEMDSVHCDTGASGVFVAGRNPSSLVRRLRNGCSTRQNVTNATAADTAVRIEVPNNCVAMEAGGNRWRRGNIPSRTGFCKYGWFRYIPKDRRDIQ